MFCCCEYQDRSHDVDRVIGERHHLKIKHVFAKLIGDVVLTVETLFQESSALPIVTISACTYLCTYCVETQRQRRAQPGSRNQECRDKTWNHYLPMNRFGRYTYISNHRSRSSYVWIKGYCHPSFLFSDTQAFKCLQESCYSPSSEQPFCSTLPEILLCPLPLHLLLLFCLLRR